jgi:hypothetical protein
MMFWRRKKPEPIYNLVDILKANPDKMYICEEFMAVYIPGFEKALIIPGNYAALGEEEANLVLQLYLAKMN